jgi:hypothetical protein
MFGTPNGGSAWADVQDMAKVGIGMIMGKLSFAAPLLAPLTWLLNETQITLSQMDKDDSFIKGLAKSSDPGIPYAIVAGDVYERMQNTENQGFFKKLITKATTKVVDSWVFGDHHDIAVSVEAIHAVADERSPKPEKHNVLCDHMSYFIDKESLALFGKLLSEACK